MGQLLDFSCSVSSLFPCDVQEDPTSSLQFVNTGQECRAKKRPLRDSCVIFLYHWIYTAKIFLKGHFENTSDLNCCNSEWCSVDCMPPTCLYSCLRTLGHGPHETWYLGGDLLPDLDQDITELMDSVIVASDGLKQNVPVVFNRIQARRARSSLWLLWTLSHEGCLIVQCTCC